MAARLSLVSGRRAGPARGRVRRAAVFEVDWFLVSAVRHSRRGHDPRVEQFRQSLAAGRLATTYLFVGPEGVGKRAFALQLAKALLCTASDSAGLEPCGRCESCTLAAAGNHPDVLLVERLAGSKFLLVE